MPARAARRLPFDITVTDDSHPSATSLFPDTAVGRLCRDTDWSRTPFGPVESWPAGLRMAVAMVLRQGLPQSLCWGPDLLQVYNDGYAVIMGDKHPAGYGKPVLENWAEIAGTVGPLFARVLEGETVTFEDLPLRVHRDGRVQDTFFTFSYSPVPTETGEIGGALINCQETTDEMLGRRAQAERDRLVQALTVERTRLAAVFRQSPSFLAILRGPDNVFELVNEAYEQIVGHGRNLLGRALFDALPETRGQGFDTFLGRVRATGEPLVFRDLPVMVDRAAGAPLEQRFIDITYMPLIEADGSRDAVIAHGTDVTEQVLARQKAAALLAESERAQEELQSSAVRLEERTEEAEEARRITEAIVEAVTDGFVAFDEEMRYTYVNGRAAEMWGLTAAQMLGHTPHELWPDMDRSAFLVALQRVRVTGRAERLEGYSSSLHIPIELRAYPSRTGGLVVFFTDVSEQRRAEAAATFLAEVTGVLASSGDYHATLVNLARLAVPRLGDWCAVDVIAEPDSGRWPPRLERVAAVHADPDKAELARGITSRFPQRWETDVGTPGVIRTREPMFVAEVTDAMLAASAQSEDHLAQLRALTIRSIMIVPLIARDRVLGTLTLVMSESDRRFTESDLQLALDLGQRAGVAVDNARLLRDADEANAAKTGFLRTVSHELRQPLNAMRGYIDLWQLGLRGEITPALRDDIARLSRNQEHLSVLIEDLLSFTRLDAGQLEVDRVPVAVAGAFTALDGMMRPQMTARGVTFIAEPCDPEVCALGDEDRIIQICLNLLTNGMRATAAGGRVTLECARDEETVAIAVTDTGVGIPADKLEAIFTPFTQLGRSLNAPKEGAGLGLAISRGLAETMNGTLTVTSTPGEGSTFTLRLPRA